MITSLGTIFVGRQEVRTKLTWLASEMQLMGARTLDEEGAPLVQIVLALCLFSACCFLRMLHALVTLPRATPPS